MENSFIINIYANRTVCKQDVLSPPTIPEKINIFLFLLTCNARFTAAFFETDHNSAEQADGRILGHLHAVPAHTLIVELEHTDIEE